MRFLSCFPFYELIISNWFILLRLANTEPSVVQWENSFYLGRTFTHLSISEAAGFLDSERKLENPAESHTKLHELIATHYIIQSTHLFRLTLVLAMETRIVQIIFM